MRLWSTNHILKDRLPTAMVAREQQEVVGNDRSRRNVWESLSGNKEENW
jgi:hypothetical protein